LGPLNYLDFTLQLTLAPDAKCRVFARSSRGGEAEHKVCLPFELETISAIRARLHDEAQWRASAPRTASGHRDGSTGLREAVVGGAPTLSVNDFGKKLYDAIFQGPVGELFAVNREHARLEKCGLRVKVATSDASLALIPWELFRKPHGRYLSLSDETPLVRHLPVDRPQARLQFAPPLRLLGVLSNGNGAPLDLERERAMIVAELAPLERKGLAEVEWLENPTRRKLREVLKRRDWHILHFAGHGSFDSGSSQGLLSMASEGGGHARLRADTLRDMLHEHPSLQMVFLNACDGAVGSAQELFSSTAAIVTDAGVPVVLAMQFPIRDDVAAEFARCVYHQLAAGDAVEEAVTAARQEISVSHDDTLEWATPVLFMHSAEGASLRVASELSEYAPRVESASIEAPLTSPSPDPQGTLVPTTQPSHEAAAPRRDEGATALPAAASPLARRQGPLVVAAALLALTLAAFVLPVTNHWNSASGPPNAAAPPANALAALAPPTSASSVGSYDWSNPCSPTVGTTGWVTRVRSALCDLESERPASAWRKLDELARNGDLSDEARGVVSRHMSRASQAAGQLSAQTTEPPAALTLSLDDGQVVTPGVVALVNPGRRTLTVSKNGREARVIVLQVSPGTVTAVTVPSYRPSPEKATSHGSKICDDRRNCVPL
jgi:CHAT domain